MRAALSSSSLGFILLSTFAGIACAADEESPQSVIVSATGIPTPQDQIASSVTLITAADIAARQERTLPDVLMNVPGLNLLQTGGPGGPTSIFMRGTNPNHTKVIVDGMDVSDPSSSNGSFEFAHFMARGIERVEILRGPQSGLYGADAVGGVIDITTAKGSGPAKLSGTIEGGSFDTLNQAASLRGSLEAFSYSLDLEHVHAGSTPVTPLDLLPPGQLRNNDYYDNLTASTKLGYTFTPYLDIGLVARYTDTHSLNTDDAFDLATFTSTPAAVRSQGETTHYYTRGTAHLSLLDGFFDQTLGIAYSRDRSSHIDPFDFETLNTGARTKVDWRGALTFSPAEIVLLGAEHARDEINDPISASTTIDSGYVELQSQPFEGFSAALNARYDANSRFGSKVTYRVAPAYRFEATGTKLKASVGSGFKAPSLSELFQDFPPFFFANPNLKSESSTGYDFGVEQSIWGDRLQAGVTYFHNHIHDLIATAASGITYANIGRATTDGIESFVEYRPILTVTLRADYTYIQATDDVLNQQLLRRPKHRGTLSAGWQVTHALSLDATLLTQGSWIDGNRDFSVPRLNAPGYTVLNVAGQYELDSHWSVFARVDNLNDRHYQNPVGFLQPTLGAYAGVNMKF